MLQLSTYITFFVFTICPIFSTYRYNLLRSGLFSVMIIFGLITMGIAPIPLIPSINAIRLFPKLSVDMFLSSAASFVPIINTTTLGLNRDTLLSKSLMMFCVVCPLMAVLIITSYGLCISHLIRSAKISLYGLIPCVCFAPWVMLFPVNTQLTGSELSRSTSICSLSVSAVVSAMIFLYVNERLFEISSLTLTDILTVPFPVGTMVVINLSDTEAIFALFSPNIRETSVFRDPKFSPTTLIVSLLYAILGINRLIFGFSSSESGILSFIPSVSLLQEGKIKSQNIKKNDIFDCCIFCTNDIPHNMGLRR